MSLKKDPIKIFSGIHLIENMSDEYPDYQYSNIP
jgi:hypothetical protein